MKKATLFSFALCALLACNSPENNTPQNTGEPTDNEAPAVGGEKDEHGCISAAGESWSEIKQSCVQIFTIGQRLNPLAISEEAVISAFVLYNDDRSKLELFLPNESKTIVLDKGTDETYQNDSLKFDTKESALYINGEKKYTAE